MLINIFKFSNMMKKTIVKKIGKKGKGVFAQKDFKKGELILAIKGKVVSSAKADSMQHYYRNHICVVGDDEWALMGIPERYINHSCSPNVFDKKRKVFAMKNIKKGEELAFDYSINGPDGEDWKMKCHCKSKNCRINLNGEFFSLPNKLQKKYLPYLDEWFRKRYNDRIKKLG